MKRVYRGSTVVNIAALIFIIAAIKLSSSFLIPIVLAFFTSVLCAPIVIWLIKHKVPTALAIFVLFIFITIGIMGFVAIITQSINHFIAYLPQYDSLLSKKISWVVSIAHKYNINLSFVKAKLIDLMSNSNVLAYLKIAISQISSIVGNIVYLLLVIIFMLAEIPLLSKKINYISRLNTNSEAKIFQNISQIASGVIRYTVVKIIVGSLTGSLIFLLLSIIGIQNAAFWGLLAFLLNFIPNVGAFIAAIPAILQVLLLNSILDFIIVTIGYIVINMIVGNFIEPKMMSKYLGLSTLTVFLSLIFWGWILGITGMFLSVPLTMMIEIILRNGSSTKFYALLLSNRTSVDIPSNTKRSKSRKS